MKSSNKDSFQGEKIFVIFTDVVESCNLDKKSNFIDWRKDSFFKQLHNFLVPREREVIKSVGDALFIKSTFAGLPSKPVIECLLKDLVDIFEECKNDKRAIRITIHCLNRQYKHGDCLAKALKKTTLPFSKNKSILPFIDSLNSDLFGTDINKAARIQGLAKKPTILVTEDVVRLLSIKKNRKSYVFGNYKLHHPVPITYLKGIFDYSEKIKNGNDSKKNIKVWELSTLTGADNPVLSQESKRFHVLRFLNADVEFNSSNELNFINAIYKETNDKIFNEERRDLQEFHTDIMYRIHDIFRFKKIDFTRPSSSKPSLNPFENFKAFKDIKYDEVKISSLLNILNIKKSTSGNLTCERHPKEPPSGIHSFIPYVLLASFPSQEIASKLRSIYSFKIKDGSDKVKIIEPQTIQLYKPINLPNKSELLVLNNLNILLFFGVYNQFIDEADEETLFLQCEIQSMSVLAKGILSGLVDGFIIYKSAENKILDDISHILNKLFAQNSTRNKSFFDRVFPISIFTISAEKVNEANIEVLNMVKKNYND